MTPMSYQHERKVYKAVESFSVLCLHDGFYTTSLCKEIETNIGKVVLAGNIILFKWIATVNVG